MAAVKKRKRSIILSFCIIVLCAFFAISLISITKRINETKAEIRDVQAQYAEQVKENEKLGKVVDSGDKDEYVEEIARDKLGYVKPGEHVYYNVSATD